MPTVWVGIDSGKWTHHCVVIDQAGTVLLSKCVENNETVLLYLIEAVATMADSDNVCWATHLNSDGAALLIVLLAAHGQQLLYPRTDRVPRHGDLPGRRQNRRKRRPDHRRSSFDAHRFAARPRRGPDQRRPATAHGPPHRCDLRPGPGSIGSAPHGWSTFLASNGPSPIPRARPHSRCSPGT